MAYIKPLYSKTKVDKAGVTLLDPNRTEEDLDLYLEAIDVINNWRSSHVYPLQKIKTTLENRAKRLDRNALTVQRLKRIRSIYRKLGELKTTRLSSMQDIGGCRTIVSTMDHVLDLVEVYENADMTNPDGRPVWIDTDDYIAVPKPTGYRSYHLIFRYESQAENCKVWNGYKIEIQIRTLLQHYWATAVETASTFLGESLKQNSGNERWLRFFALASAVFAQNEGCSAVPNTPEDRSALLLETFELFEELKVEPFLSAFRVASEYTAAANYQKSERFLLQLNAITRLVKITPFGKQEIKQATEAYNQAEFESRDKPEIDVVLVNAKGIKNLKKAYPNYYLDTDKFIRSRMESLSDLPLHILNAVPRT